MQPKDLPLGHKKECNFQASLFGHRCYYKWSSVCVFSTNILGYKICTIQLRYKFIKVLDLFLKILTGSQAKKKRKEKKGGGGANIKLTLFLNLYFFFLKHTKNILC